MHVHSTQGRRPCSNRPPHHGPGAAPLRRGRTVLGWPELRLFLCVLHGQFLIVGRHLGQLTGKHEIPRCASSVVRAALRLHSTARFFEPFHGVGHGQSKHDAHIHNLRRKTQLTNGNATLLRSCANGGDYFEVAQASQLNDVSKTIAKSLATLRIAK